MATNGKVKSNPLNKPSQNPGLLCVRIAISVRAFYALVAGTVLIGRAPRPLACRT
jgi:hypothetical protein